MPFGGKDAASRCGHDLCGRLCRLWPNPGQARDVAGRPLGKLRSLAADHLCLARPVQPIRDRRNSPKWHFLFSFSGSSLLDRSDRGIADECHRVQFRSNFALRFLKESVSPMRWMGIVLVVIGVVLIARGGGD